MSFHAPYKRVLAFQSDPELEATGWYRRQGGGFVRTSDVRLDAPSDFVGVENPVLPLALLPARTQRSLDGGTLDASAGRIGEEDAHSVVTDLGTFARAQVRIARAIERPAQVPPDAKWVHVDLKAQTLVAYEGDTPRYATLVSSGKEDSDETRTHPGLFRISYKALHDRMHGDDYYLEDVPYVMPFHRNEALHGTFWHSAFGSTASHGCVNLSLRDAEWLFSWAPPNLPAGWHTVYVQPDSDALWVYLTR